MSKRRHKFTVIDAEALAKAYPLAVTETHIPARIEHKVDYLYIAGLLDLKLPVPGIEIIDETPAFLKNAKKDDVE